MTRSDVILKQLTYRPRALAIATLTALAIAAALGLTGCGSNDTSGESPSSSSSSQMASPNPSESAAAQFNDADVMFVQMMIPHHQQAVALSDTVLKKSGISAETTALAADIKAAQQPEITTMEGWLKTWGQDMGDMGGMNHGGPDDGMATDDELKNFDQVDGAAAEKMYLELMTRHHQGAITMAQAETSTGASPDAVALANGIATSQQEEITTMKELLANL